jgi:pimeloyl-ACP methyl ester carboxylesterase
MSDHEQRQVYEFSFSRMPTSHFIEAGTMKFHYLEWDGYGEYTVILLHGIGDNAAIWSPLAAALPREVRVIAFDQRGHGNSDRPNPPAYTCDDYVGDLGRCIDALGLSNVIVGGHSMGALHGTAYASLRPSRVAGLIHADIEPCPPEWNKKYLTNMYHNAPSTYPSVDAYALDMQKNSPHADLRLLRRIAAEALDRRPDGAYACRYDREVLSHFDRYDVRPLLGSIGCPTLVVRGSESRVMRREVAEEMGRAIPGGRFVEIPKAAHPVHTENPEEFHRAVIDFLKGIGVIGGE